MMSNEMKVYLVDDDSAVRDSLRAYMKANDLDVVCCISATNFLDVYDKERPGCLVLDMHLPDLSGLELQQILQTRHVNIPIIFISGDAHVGDSVQAIKKGALDFLEKPLQLDLLIQRVHEAMAASSATWASQLEREELLRCCERLTKREREVMALLLRGQANKGVARALGISHRTVEIHRSHIMEKMKARTLVELAEMVHI